MRLRLVAVIALLAGCSRTSPPTPAAGTAPPVPDPQLREAEAPVREKVHAARRSLEHNLDSAGAWGRLGLVLDAHGLHDDALVCYRQAASLDPADPRWPQLAGMVLAVDDPEASIAWFEAAAALDPEAPALRQTFGDALMRAGRADAARGQYETALALDPEARRALLGLAELALRAGSPGEAVELLHRALELDFCDREVHARLARAYQRLGDVGAAEREALLVKAYPDLAPFADPVRALVTREAVSARAHNDRGLRALGEGRLEDAQDDFREAVRLHPESVRFRLNLGGVLVRRGRASEALTVLGEALAMAPDDPQALNNLAVALMETGELADAQSRLERALEIDPRHDEAQYNLGTVLERRGDPDAAAAAWRLALELNPVNVPAHLALARHLAGRDEPRAVEHWRLAAEYGCAHPEAMLRLAMLMAGRGRFADATSLLERGLDAAPRDESLLTALVTILATCPRAEQRDGSRAVTLARALLERTGADHVPSLGLLAASRAEAGDFQGAVETARRALDLARSAGNRPAAEALSAQLQLYESGRPFHQGG